MIAALTYVAGCHPEPNSGEDPPEDVETASAALSAVEGRRWVVYQPTGGCANLPDWSASPLFPPSASLPPQLVDYCLYIWSGSTPVPTPADVGTWQAAIGTTDFAEDSALVVPLTVPQPYSDQLDAFMRTSLKQRVGKVTTSPLVAPSVHVAVLDTTPDEAPWTQRTGQNRHGDTMAALIAEIAGPLGAGAATVSTFLAMPRRFNPGAQSVSHFPELGGDFGHLSDLARALWTAVLDHQANHVGQKLILNLSLGWEPLGPDSSCDASPAPAARAVKAVLDHAACAHDALVLAAAGNHMGGMAPASGPMCPAAWTGTPTSCHSTKPLVVAAYGLDYLDEPIALARPESAVSLAAPAIGGQAHAAGTSSPEPLTGTSVAAAVMSAVAAVAWAAYPGDNALQVTSRLHTNGVSLSHQVNQPTVGLQFPQVMRRVSLCSVLAPLANGGWACQSTNAAAGASNPDFDAGTKGALIGSIDPNDPTNPITTINPSNLLDTNGPHAAGGQCLVFPQPAATTCSRCALVNTSANAPSYRFYGELAPGVLLGPPLTLFVQGAGGVTTYSLAGAQANTWFAVDLSSAPAGVQAAWVSAVDPANLSVPQQIFVSN